MKSHFKMKLTKASLEAKYPGFTVNKLGRRSWVVKHLQTGLSSTSIISRLDLAESVIQEFDSTKHRRDHWRTHD